MCGARTCACKCGRAELAVLHAVAGRILRWPAGTGAAELRCTQLRGVPDAAEQVRSGAPGGTSVLDVLSARSSGSFPAACSKRLLTFYTGPAEGGMLRGGAATCGAEAASCQCRRRAPTFLRPKACLFMIDGFSRDSLPSPRLLLTAPPRRRSSALHWFRDRSICSSILHRSML